MRFLQKIRPALTSSFCRCLTWRHMQLFVGGLSYDTNESVLKDVFENYGEIVEVKVICDRVSGKSRGYGFVRFSSEAAANKALKEMDGLLLDGRNIRIHSAHREGSKEVRRVQQHTQPKHGKVSTMAWRGQLSRNLKELRILFSPNSSSSSSTRAFIENNYKDLKTKNPKLPILIREATGIEPQLWARYGFGVERGIRLEGLSEEQISKALEDLNKAGAGLKS